MYCRRQLANCVLLHSVFFFNDTATTEIYTLSLHDALPIFEGTPDTVGEAQALRLVEGPETEAVLSIFRGSSTTEIEPDRKSTRLNSSHSQISYAVFCLKKKNKTRDRVPSICHDKTNSVCSR